MDGDGFDQARTFTVIEGGGAEGERVELVRAVAIQMATLSQLLVALVAAPGARRSLSLLADEMSRHL